MTRYRYQNETTGTAYDFKTTPGGCELWLGGLSSDGYAKVHDSRTQTSRVAHRVRWEEKYGPVPVGYELDHLCHSYSTDCPGGSQCKHRRCINLDHLEVVSKGENIRRGIQTRDGDYCRNGHPKIPENREPRADRDGDRCRICYKTGKSRSYQRNATEIKAKSKERKRRIRAEALLTKQVVS